MDSLARWLRSSGYVLLAAGVGRLLIAYFGDEVVNRSGLVPGIGVGYVLVAIGAYALWSAALARDRRTGWLILPAALTLVAIASAWFMVFGDGQPREYALLPPGPLGALAFFGFAITMFLVVNMLVLTPLMYGLAWLVDRVPALRRRGAGACIRSQWRR